MKTIEMVRNANVVIVDDGHTYVERYIRASFNAWELFHDNYKKNVCGACGFDWHNNACTVCDELPHVVSDIFVAKRIRFADKEGESVAIRP
jgi:hypothetical protein